MVFNDRLKRALYALFKASVPRLDYLARYTGRVVLQQQGTNLFDLQPDDPRIPPMGGVPLRLGYPGGLVSIKKGTTMLIGWENGDPARPFCDGFGGDEQVFSLTVIAENVYLGDKSTSDGGSLDPVRAGVLTGESIDPFTGAQHFALGNASQHVRAKKV